MFGGSNFKHRTGEDGQVGTTRMETEGRSRAAAPKQPPENLITGQQVPDDL